MERPSGTERFCAGGPFFMGGSGWVGLKPFIRFVNGSAREEQL